MSILQEMGCCFSQLVFLPQFIITLHSFASSISLILYEPKPSCIKGKYVNNETTEATGTISLWIKFFTLIFCQTLSTLCGRGILLNVSLLYCKYLVCPEISTEFFWKEFDFFKFISTCSFEILKNLN